MARLEPLLLLCLCVPARAQYMPDGGPMEERPIGGPGGLAPRDLDAGAPASCEDSRVQAMLMRAVREYASGCGAGAAASVFGRVFGTGDAAGAGGVGRRAVVTAAQEIADKIRDGRIRARCSSSGSSSASWGAVFAEGQVTGEVAVKAIDVEQGVLADPGPRGRGGMDLFRQEQLADSLIHETAHIFYSIFKDEQGARPVWNPEELTTTFARGSKFWDGTELCGPQDRRAREACGRHANEFSVGQHGNYGGGNKANEEGARLIAQQIYMCSPAGSVVGRVLGLRASL